MERQAPRQVMYENQLPLAIESKSTRRLFFPEGGSEYGPTGNGQRPNIIRIPINADSLLDVQHSFLQFKLTNNSATANSGIAPDFGLPFVRRLRIESAGTTLEDIEEYGKLYGGILFPAQASVGAVQDSSITTAGVGDTSAAVTIGAGGLADAATIVDGDMTTAIGATNGGNESANIRAAILEAVNALGTSVNTDVTGTGSVTGASTLSGVKHGLASTIGPGSSVTYNVPLVSALMNMDKYLPLVMMNAGLTLELELDVANSLGVSVTDARAGQAVVGADADWKISDVRYVAHLIDLQRDFYDKMRMVMEGSGGVLQLAGSTFRHYAATADAASQELVVNIPSRVKSIKSVFFTQQLNTQKSSNTHFGVSESIPNNISEYQFRIGSVVYPSTSVKVDATAHNGVYTNKGEAYSELRKAFGTLGDYSEGGVLLNKDTYLEGAPSTKASSAYANNAQPVVPTLCPFGLDFEAFPKTALESGVNTADRSLPMTLEVKKHSGAGFNVNVDVFVMCDAIFYVNLDGSVSVSI